MTIATPVLVTTAIKPPADMPFLEMKDPASRLIAARGSIFFTAAQGVSKIVVADATGAEIFDQDDVDLLREAGCEIEQIAYRQDEHLVRRNGKGFGEGMLIQRAIEDSSLIRETGAFYKLTSKVICRNIERIDELLPKVNISSIFWRDPLQGRLPHARVDARFFFTSVSFARDVVVPAFLRSMDERQAAESCLFEAVNDVMQSATAPRPLLSGLSGGSGKAYFDDNLGFLDRAFPCWVARHA